MQKLGGRGFLPFEGLTHVDMLSFFMRTRGGSVSIQFPKLEKESKDGEPVDPILIISSFAMFAVHL